MQCLTLKENFLFTSQIKLNIDRRNSELSETIDSTLLTTINALYIFKKNDVKNDEFLENKLLLKCKHEDIYVEKFTNEFNEIKYTSINENSDLKFSIKLEDPLAKEYVKILALFEGWKLAVSYTKNIKVRNYSKSVIINTNNNDKNDNESKSPKKTKKNNQKEPYPKSFILFQIIDTFIQNNFVFQIDDLILRVYKDFPTFMEQFFYVITIFPKIEINLMLDENSSAKFPLLFPSDKISLRDSLPNINLKYSLIHLSLKSIFLKDSYAEKILPPLIVKSPFLQTLDLSHNNLTNKIFSTLVIKGFINVHLKTLNISYNNLSSDNLTKYIFLISKQFLRITLFDLRGNKIDNRFLNSFNPKFYEDLRNHIQEKLSGNNSNNNYSKEIVSFDLRETNINLDKTSLRLYLKKKRDLSNHLEIKNNFNENYETKFFGLETINFIFDIYFFKKNFYKYNSCSRSKTKLNIDVKNFQLKLPSTINEKLIKKHNPCNNWFFTNYYEKDEDAEEAKIDAKSVDMNGPKKKNKNEEINKANEEEKIKIKNENENPKRFKKLNSQKNIKAKDNNNKKILENSSKVTVKEPENILGDPSKVIPEENSDSGSDSFNLDNMKNNEKNEEKKNEENIDNKNVEDNNNNQIKDKPPNSKNTDDENENNNQEDNENNNNNISKKDENQLDEKEEEKQEEKKEEKQEEKPEENNINEGEEQKQNEDLTKTNTMKRLNDYRNNDTLIITKTDDESESEEEIKPVVVTERKKKEISKSKTFMESSPSKKKKSLRNRNTIYEKNVDTEKINAAKKYHELDLYRELFQFFFLLDYYFDPVLNSFATKMPQGIKREKSYMDFKNEDRRYEALKDYINLISNKKSLKKYKYDEEEIYIGDLYINDIKQMYYDYHNLLRIRNSNTIRKLTTKQVLISLFKNIIKNSVTIFKSDKKFNPNGLIEHICFFYLYLASPHDYKIKIPLTTLNKLISRIKLESLLCLQEKSHHALGTLSKITSSLDISVKNQVNSVFVQLTEKAKLILKGLLRVLNFQGYNEVDNVKGFLFETGNFLDIFLEKAESINLSNDLVILCKYIQYWRNNYLRNLIYNLMHEISKKEVTTRGCDMTEEFAKANEDYKNIPIKNMGLTKDIKFPEFAQHPSNVDYLYLSEKDDVDFEKDLKNITRYIKADQTYFKRNLYDRINFLFCTTSRNRKNKKNTYSLHRGNTYLKVMRILFRYNNNLDYKKLEKKMKSMNQEYINIESFLNVYNLNSSSIANGKIFNDMIFDKKILNAPKNTYNIDNYIDISDSLSKIAIEESYLRIIDFPDSENLESEITKRDKKKIRLLLHSDNYNDPETLLDLDKKLTQEQLNLFIETTKNFNSKCQEKLGNLEAITSKIFITIVQDYIKYFLIIKAKYKNQRKLWEYQNLECFYQLYRFANKNNFNYKKEKNDIDYSFAFLTIMCFYFEFSVPMVKRVKNFAYYLFSQLNHRKYCKTIIRALNNPFRYNWVMSTFEIYRKIDNSAFYLSIYYPSHDSSFKEKFEITETTTASDLMKDVIEKGKVLKDSKEKDFYWIYFTNNEDPLKFQYINHEQILVQLIAEEEQDEAGENDIIINVLTENNLNEEKSIRSLNSSRINDSNVIERNEKILENNCEQKTFKKMHFEIKRRIFTPNLLNGNLDSYNYYERELLYNQIKDIFYSSEIVDYTWSGIGEKIAIVCYLENLAEKRRQKNIQRENELENRISSSRVVTKFDLDMREIEALPFFDNQSLKEESFISEHNLTYNNNNKDKMSFGLNSIGSDKYSMTYKSYAFKEQKSNINRNMDIIKEEEDDDNNNNLNNSNHDSINNKNEVIKIINTDDLDKEVLIPKNIDVKDQPLKQIYSELASKVHNLSDPKKLFFNLVKERPILMANIFEVNNKQSNESFPEKFLISINMDKVDFLYRTNYTKFFEFKYEEIIKCLILDNYILLLVINVFKDEIDQKTEIIIKIESTDNRFIMEDILSYAQLYLATKTKSQFVSIKDNCVSFAHGYKAMFDRCLPFRTTYSSPNEMNKIEIEKMRQLLHNNELYKKYKEEKAKKKEEEIKESQKGKLDIKSMTNIMRFNNFDEELDSEESEASVRVIPLKLNINKKPENNVINNNNENESKEDIKAENNNIEKKEESKEEEKEEEKVPVKTEEEIKKEMETKQKMEENEKKRNEVDKVLSKALMDFHFDDESENKESEYE